MAGREFEDLIRQLAPQVLGALVRRYGHFDMAEDATQEALLAASQQWPSEGIPDNPRAWLITVASRRLTDMLRAEQARQRREEVVAQQMGLDDWLAPPADAEPSGDDALVLLFMCCHPSLSPASQIALTLRAVGGLRTAEVARAFLVPEATMTRRITRAKQNIKSSGVAFQVPSDPTRLTVVLHVLYLIFNEGYATTSGPSLQRTELSTEAIRLTRLVRRLLPDIAEVTGLLALMLLTDARRPARTGTVGGTHSHGGPGPSPVELFAHRRRQCPWSRRRWRVGLSGPTRCRPRSPRCTTRHRRPRRPTGRRSGRSTRCYWVCQTTRSWH